MEKETKIGVFDSGISGITVLKEIIRILPNENYIYFSDSLYNPYGDKSPKKIIHRCEEITQFLIKENCKAIVIACNTASATAVQYLRKKYKNMLFIAIEPAYKMVYDYAYEKPTLVMATKGTIRSEKFNLLFQKYNNHKTYLHACIGLADIIEKGDKEKIQKYLKKEIGIFKGKVNNVVLGCTHYPLIETQIREVLGKDITFFNGAARLAIHLKDELEARDLLENKEGKVEFLDSQNLPEKEKRFWELLKIEEGKKYEIIK